MVLFPFGELLIKSPWSWRSITDTVFWYILRTFQYISSNARYEWYFRKTSVFFNYSWKRQHDTNTCDSSGRWGQRPLQVDFSWWYQGMHLLLLNWLVKQITATCVAAVRLCVKSWLVNRYCNVKFSMAKPRHMAN